MYRNILIVFVSVLSGPLFSQFDFDSVLSRHPLLQKISAQPQKYHLQIIYTRIDRHANETTFNTYSLNVKPENYLYCASLVKLPVSILALQKLNELNLKQGTMMQTDSAASCQFKVTKDTTSINLYPSIENYIKRMFLVSDNFSFSRVYEFLGIDYMHQNLKRCGFPNIRIVNRYDGSCAGKDNFITNPVTFKDAEGKVLYHQDQQVSAMGYDPVMKTISVGKAYYIGNKKLERKPKDFTYSNYFTLADCHRMMQELIFPQAKCFDITDEQRAFLVRYLGLYPRQSSSPKYDPKAYPDNYKKYLFYGDNRTMITDSSLVIMNIVGQSYGFMSDCAYFYDKVNDIGFMLSAGLYANEDEVLNDGKYDYKTVALPFLAELGRQVYQYELRQKRKQK